MENHTHDGVQVQPQVIYSDFKMTYSLTIDKQKQNIVIYTKTRPDRHKYWLISITRPESVKNMINETKT